MRKYLRVIYHKVKPIINGVLRRISPKLGATLYTMMQKRAYKKYTGNIEDAKHLCVGHFETHERYPYDQYLLKRFKGEFGLALDFGCGVGRMMNRMQKYFDKIHGIDISKNNIEHARKYLVQNGIDSLRFELFLSSGND